MSAAETDVPEVVGLTGGAAVAVDVDVLSSQDSVPQTWPSLQQPPPREDAQEKKLDVHGDAADGEMITVVGETMVVVSVLSSPLMVTVAVVVYPETIVVGPANRADDVDGLAVVVLVEVAVTMSVP